MTIRSKAMMERFLTENGASAEKIKEFGEAFDEDFAKAENKHREAANAQQVEESKMRRQIADLAEEANITRRR